MAASDWESSLPLSSESFSSPGDSKYNEMTAPHDDEGSSGKDKRGKATIN
jgi:hypothetical protein